MWRLHNPKRKAATAYSPATQRSFSIAVSQSRPSSTETEPPCTDTTASGKQILQCRRAKYDYQNMPRYGYHKGSCALPCCCSLHICSCCRSHSRTCPEKNHHGDPNCHCSWFQTLTRRKTLPRPRIQKPSSVSKQLETQKGFRKCKHLSITYKCIFEFHPDIIAI